MKKCSKSWYSAKKLWPARSAAGKLCATIRASVILVPAQALPDVQKQAVPDAADANNKRRTAALAVLYSIDRKIGYKRGQPLKRRS